MKKVLVTGGAGFLGSHLCRKLLERGCDVVCSDNFFTGSKSNIQSLRSHPNFELLRHDVTNPVIVEVDQVYNLACPASPVHYQYDPIKTVKTNVLGTINMLDLCGQVNARMFQASTSEVYGDPEIHPQPETYWGNVNPLGVRSCYDEGKRVAETLCMDYFREKGVEVKIARIFNTYGPHMAVSDGRVVSNFIIQALKGQPLTIYGDGTQTRSFCYVSDLIRGVLSLMDESGTDPGPVNLGNPQECTMVELAQTIIRLSGSNSAIEHQPLPSDDPKRRKPDITQARERLKWSPEISLEDGLAKTIEYFEAILSEGAF